MKGFNVKKLAAVAVGAALIGSTLASVTADVITKEDLYKPAPLPVVVGSMAKVSDAVWAGNIAAALANKATTEMEVDVTGAVEGGDCTVENVVVDLTVGGEVSYTSGAKETKIELVSSSGAEEIDTNTYNNAQLSNLYNTTLAQKVDNNSTTPTITEQIGITVDAKMDTSSDIKDLTAYIESGQLYYNVNLGSSGIDLGTTSFTDGTDDRVRIMFFGEEYELSTATLSGTPHIKMVKSSAKETYNEGQTITGLEGRINYEGQEMEVTLTQITQAGTAVTTYSATFELYDEEGNLVNTQTVTTGENLADVFQDSEGDYALQSNLFIDTIALGATTGVGYIEVTKGSNTVELYSTKGYPYDSTDTSGIYDYTVTLGVSGNSLTSIKVANSRDKWNNSSSSNGPLYPKDEAQSLGGNEFNSAVFGQALDEGVLGKGFVEVEFKGFQFDQERTVVE
ncbi:MAG: hypothetical protein ABIA76_01330, partial [Candidatus Diapherotrites archaeon]